MLRTPLLPPSDASCPAGLRTASHSHTRLAHASLHRQCGQQPRRYVHTAKQRRGIGGTLLSHLRAQTGRPILVGTWADASMAIRFYEKHGFRMVPPEEKDRLLRRYWSIPDR